MSITTDRMTSSAPQYYEGSSLFLQLQAANGNEYDTLESDDQDLALQFDIITATWGLRYYEVLLFIPINLADSYETRRSRVLSKYRSPGNYSAALLETVASSFVNGEIAVTVDIPNYAVAIKFIGTRGIPPSLPDVQEAINNLVHAHLVVSYAFTYLTFAELTTANKTFTQLTALGFTFDQLAVWSP